MKKVEEEVRSFSQRQNHWAQGLHGRSQRCRNIQNNKALRKTTGNSDEKRWHKKNDGWQDIKKWLVLLRLTIGIRLNMLGRKENFSIGRNSNGSWWMQVNWKNQGLITFSLYNFFNTSSTHLFIVFILITEHWFSWLCGWMACFIFLIFYFF